MQRNSLNAPDAAVVAAPPRVAHTETSGFVARTGVARATIVTGTVGAGFWTPRADTPALWNNGPVAGNAHEAWTWRNRARTRQPGAHTPCTNRAVLVAHAPIAAARGVPGLQSLLVLQICCLVLNVVSGRFQVPSGCLYHSLRLQRAPNVTHHTGAHTLGCKRRTFQARLHTPRTRSKTSRTGTCAGTQARPASAGSSHGTVRQPLGTAGTHVYSAGSCIKTAVVGAISISHSVLFGGWQSRTSKHAFLQGASAQTVNEGRPTNDAGAGTHRRT